MNETIVTAVGRIASPVDLRRFGDGGVRASFRVACNERRRDWKTGDWVDGDTLYMSVTCWRGLAENVKASLGVGDPVVVRGRMYTRQYETEGRRMSVVEMDATAAGPDLARCTSVIARTPTGATGRPAAEAPGSAPALEETAGAASAEGWQTGPLLRQDEAPETRVLASVGGSAEAADGGPEHRN